MYDLKMWNQFQKGQSWKKGIQVAGELHGKKGFPVFTGRETAHQIYAIFTINDVHGRAIGLNHLLNIELCGHNTKVFDQAWRKNIDGDGQDKELEGI